MANGSEVLLGLQLRVKTLMNERNKLNIVLNMFLRDVRITTDWLFGIGFGHYFQ